MAGAKMKRHGASVLLLLLLTGVPRLGLADEPERVQYRPSPNVRVLADLEFARYGTRVLRLDLYLPARRSSAPIPAFVVVRGGGWLVNDRKEWAPIASALAERNVAAACIEYRLGSEAPFPGAVQDVKAAIRWTRANARKYRIRPEAIGTLGGSSGAYMALLAGVSAGERELEGGGGTPGTSSAVQAVVAMATPADLRLLGEGGQQTAQKFLRLGPREDPELWAFASPVTHIDAADPPVLLLHGGDDTAVAPEQSALFAREYAKVGAKAELHVLGGAPHAFWNYVPWFGQTMDEAADFLVRVAGGPGVAPK
jgi:acetyl esterase/lipase